MIDRDNILTIARKELRDALRNRWFLFFTLAFTGLALMLSTMTQSGNSRMAVSGYDRAAAGLINLVLLFVPLIGLTLGAANLVGERETGTLAYLLAQPVTRAEVLLGKYTGFAGALFASLSLGFGVAGTIMALQGQISSAGDYLLTVALAFLLALSMLSLGFLISTIARKTATSLGSALFLWLFLVFVGDLGIMGTAMITRMSIQNLFILTSMNPLQMFKMASILTIRADLEVLGPAGLYATQQFGDGLLAIFLVGLLAWVVLPLSAALLIFTRQERLPLFKKA